VTNEIAIDIRADVRAEQSGAHQVASATGAIAHREPFVEETQFYRSLHFRPGEAQSRMLKREPDRLVLDYTRTMMAFLLFNSAPRRIAMLGLGGGSLAKFCYRELADARIDVVEINPRVVALREAFHIPADDDRFHVHLDDGAGFIRRSPGCFDVLLVDAYTRDGIPAQLASSQFYDSCRDSLRGEGILVSNLYCRDADRHVDEIARSFSTPMLAIDEADGTNRIVVACRNPASLQRATLHRPAHIRPLAWSSLQSALLRVKRAIKNPGGTRPYVHRVLTVNP
jgi:spermidine synthase